MATDGFDSGGVDIPGDTVVIPPFKSWPWWSGDVLWLPIMRRLMEEKGRTRTQHLINMCPRPVTQSEANALAELIGADMARNGLVKLSVMAAGAVLALRSGFRLPFQKLNPAKYNERAFPSLGRPWVVGTPAKYLWLATRATAYSFVLMFPASLAQAFYGTMAATKFMRDDPRLANLRLTVINKTMDGDLSRDTAALAKAAQKMSSDEIRKQNEAAQEKYERMKQQCQDGEGQFAKLRPEERTHFLEMLEKRFEAAQKVTRSVLEARENPAMVEKQRLDYQTLSDTDASGSAPSTTNTLGLPRKSPSPSRPAPEETTQGWGDSSAFTSDRGEDLDDASPVAYGSRQRDSRQRDTGATGSAWDRVRRQADLGKSPADNDVDDSWGTTSEQKADSKSKRKAQQEFDELVDRERRV
ncbi:hypothetical protein F5X68DRAFT_203489 [Plectosphaerella plurivora]|uniref:Uncharacterized protein n=1 Tax=Plectosphaerella plurivora TaxID=936078 RepID=A0A9P8VH35_9PEZI|nr:hypothetical protein F5X68DRAFT_203489 [Plectosphaerella plurivora]